MKSLLLLTLCAISFGSSETAAAQSSIVQQGATVRFRLGTEDAFRSGQLATLTADSLILTRCPTCNGRLLYGRSEINSLEVMRNTDSGSRIVHGVLLGAAVGGGLGYLSATTCHGTEKCDLAGLAVPFGAVLGGLIGAAAGYLGSYKWEPVPAPR